MASSSIPNDSVTVSCSWYGLTKIQRPDCTSEIASVYLETGTAPESGLTGKTLVVIEGDIPPESLRQLPFTYYTGSPSTAHRCWTIELTFEQMSRLKMIASIFHNNSTAVKRSEVDITVKMPREWDANKHYCLTIISKESGLQAQFIKESEKVSLEENQIKLLNVCGVFLNKLMSKYAIELGKKLQVFPSDIGIGPGQLPRLTNDFFNPKDRATALHRAIEETPKEKIDQFIREIDEIDNRPGPYSHEESKKAKQVAALRAIGILKLEAMLGSYLATLYALQSRPYVKRIVIEVLCSDFIQFYEDFTHPGWIKSLQESLQCFRRIF